MSADPSLLAEVPLFALLDDEERKTLSGILNEHHFPAGTTIFSYGDPGDSLYIIRAGRVHITVENTEGDQIILDENTAGDVFGEISLLDAGSRSATATSVEETDVFTLDRDDLLALISRHPHAALDLLSVMGKRLRTSGTLLRHRVTRNVNVEERDRLTFGERVSDRVAAFGGSWLFILSFGFILLAWMSMNIVLAAGAFDPFPFILLNLVLSALAALQAPVIMMSQNRQAAKDRLKAELDYEINLKAELEVAALHSKFDHMYEETQAAFARLKK